MKFFTPTNRGFTLLELLVVISIIGLLASVVLTSLSAARTKARNSQRIQQITQYTKALELYRSTNNQYPTTAGYACLGDYGTGVACWGSYTSNTAFNTALDTYIDGTPPVVRAMNFGALYASAAPGSTYAIHYMMETSSSNCPLDSTTPCDDCSLAGAVRHNSSSGVPAGAIRCLYTSPD